jgi:hypothetical protein
MPRLSFHPSSARLASQTHYNPRLCFQCKLLIPRLSPQLHRHVYCLRQSFRGRPHDHPAEHRFGRPPIIVYLYHEASVHEGNGRLYLV